MVMAGNFGQKLLATISDAPYKYMYILAYGLSEIIYLQLPSEITIIYIYIYIYIYIICYIVCPPQAIQGVPQIIQYRYTPTKYLHHRYTITYTM